MLDLARYSSSVASLSKRHACMWKDAMITETTFVWAVWHAT